MSELILNDGDLADAGHWPAECVLGFYERRPSREHASFADHVDASWMTPSGRSPSPG